MAVAVIKSTVSLDLTCMVHASSTLTRPLARETVMTILVATIAVIIVRRVRHLHVPQMLLRLRAETQVSRGALIGMMRRLHGRRPHAPRLPRRLPLLAREHRICLLALLTG